MAQRFLLFACVPLLVLACTSTRAGWDFRKRVEFEQMSPACVQRWGEELLEYSRHCNEWRTYGAYEVSDRRVPAGFPADEADWVLGTLRPKIIDVLKRDSIAAIGIDVMQHKRAAIPGTDFLFWMRDKLFDFQLTHIAAIEAKFPGQQWMQGFEQYGAKGLMWIDGKLIEELPKEIFEKRDCRGTDDPSELEISKAYIQTIPGTSFSAIVFHIAGNSAAGSSFESWWRFVFVAMPEECMRPQ